MKEAIRQLQQEISKYPQPKFETHHYFADGMYCRMLPRKATTLIIGKVHRKEHLYIVASGTVRITDGQREAIEVTGPAVFVSAPGTKRAVYALTDAVCLTVHRTDKTDLDEIEAELVEEDSESMYLPGNIVKPRQLT